MEIVGKLNTWSKTETDPDKIPSFSALILKRFKEDIQYKKEEFFIASRPFYVRMDKKNFDTLQELEIYYKNRLEEGWDIEFIYPKDPQDRPSLVRPF